MDLIDRCYEAALMPDEWDGVLGGLCERAGATQAALILFDGLAKPSVKLHNGPAWQASVFQQVWRDSPAVLWGLARTPSSFTTFRKNFTAQALAVDPAVTMLYEQGLHDHAVSAHSLGEGRSIGLMFARSTAAGLYRQRDLDALDAMRPHIVRAGLVSVRLGVERAQTMVATLERLGVAAAVLGPTGKVIAANPLLEAMPTVLIPTAFGGIAVAERVKDDRFREALGKVGTGEAGPALPLPLPGVGEHPPMILHLMPVRGQARDVFSGGHVLLVVVPVGGGSVPDTTLLHGLFHLTAAEANLTRELATGETLQQIATRTGRSIHTLRVQLRSILAKTGTHRQADLMRLLSHM